MDNLGNFLAEDFIGCLGARKLGYTNGGVFSRDWFLWKCGRREGDQKKFTYEPKDDELEVTYDGKTY